MSNQVYPFSPSALAKQSMIETQPIVYPLRPITPEPAEPALIEGPQDVAELAIIACVLVVICFGFWVMLELMYPGWSVMTIEVING